MARILLGIPSPPSAVAHAIDGVLRERGRDPGLDSHTRTTAGMASWSDPGLGFRVYTSCDVMENWGVGLSLSDQGNWHNAALV